MTALVRQTIIRTNTRILGTCRTCTCSNLRYNSTQAENPVRVRFAPSPTGQIHLGGLRTALYNYLFAKSHHGKFILRIEDTDRARYVPGAAEKIMDMLDWVGLTPDEGPRQGGDHGPYYQSERLSLYEESVSTLLDQDLAYRCFCSEKRLDLVRKDAMRRGQVPKYDNKCRNLTDAEISRKIGAQIPYTIRFKLQPMVEPLHDLIHGDVIQNVAMIEGDPILMKSDGYPTYHLACVVDDRLMRITHVLRGEEWLASTAKHILLHRAFGWTPPKFAHMPLLLNSDGTKLSKRQGDIGVESLKERGYYPEAVVNLLTVAGAGFTANDTIGMTLNELVRNFRLEKLSPASGRLQVELLDAINRRHLKRKLLDSRNDVAEELRKLIGEGGGFLSSMECRERSHFLEKALEWGKDRINRVEDFLNPSFRFLWSSPVVDLDSLKSLKTDETKMVFETLETLSILDDFQVSRLQVKLKAIMERNDYTMPNFMKVLRMALCGQKHGPPIAEVMELLGKEETLRRLEKCYDVLSKK